MSRLFFSILCAMVISFPAQAQLNMNALKNKAKSAVKKEINNAQQKSNDAATSPVKEKSGTATVEAAASEAQAQAQTAQPQASAQIKPSAAAIAADPAASDMTIASGYSRPTAEIRAQYERLDPSKFRYQPYYEEGNKFFYYYGDDEVTNFHENCYYWFMQKAQDEFGIQWRSINKFVGGVPGQEGKVVPYGEHTMHAGFAEIMTDTGSSNPFNHFLRACCILKVSREASLYRSNEYKLREFERDGEKYSVVESESDRLERNSDLKAMAERKIVAESPYELLEFMADAKYKSYLDRKAKDVFVLFNYWEYDEIVKLMSDNEFLYSGSSEQQKKRQATVEKHMKQLDEMEESSHNMLRNNYKENKARANQMTMAEIPAPGMRDASMEATFKTLAKNALRGSDVIKVIIRDAGWNYDKNALGVTIARWKGTYVIYKENDKTYMIDMSFKQPANGSSYGSWVFRGLGLNNHLITDYK